MMIKVPGSYNGLEVAKDVINTIAKYNVCTEAIEDIFGYVREELKQQIIMPARVCFGVNKEIKED